MQEAMPVDEYASEPSDDGDPDAEPGATIMWFGKFLNIRLDKLEEWYRRYLVYRFKENPSPNVSGQLTIHSRVSQG